MDLVSLMSVASIAFLGSVGHCLGMCGGIVIAYSSSMIDPNSSKITKAFQHTLYSLGRTTTYAALGAVFGLLGKAVSITGDAKAIFFAVVALLMLYMGLYLLKLVPLPNFLDSNVAEAGWFRSFFGKLLSSKSFVSFYGLGLLNGLLPCGFVYFFALSAAATGSALGGALHMAVFGLATLPAMLAFGFMVSLLESTSWRAYLNKLAGVAVIAYAALTLYKAYGIYTEKSGGCPHHQSGLNGKFRTYSSGALKTLTT